MDKGSFGQSVFVMGGFDNLRTFDIRFLQESSAFGNVHVLLFSDKAYQMKHGHQPKFPLNERRYFLEKIRYVSDLTVIDQAPDDGLPEPEALLTINGLNPVWAVLEVETSSEKKSFCKDHGIEYIVIPETALEGFPIEDTGEETPDHKKKKVMVSGCFDWVHSGHVRFFEEVSAFGDLYVVVGHDDNLQLLKGEGHPMFSAEERRYWVHSIRFVWKALISSGHGWLDAEPEVRLYKPDLFVVNEDGDKPEKRKLFQELGVGYKVLARKPKPGLSARESTILKGLVKE